MHVMLYELLAWTKQIDRSYSVFSYSCISFCRCSFFNFKCTKNLFFVCCSCLPGETHIIQIGILHCYIVSPSLSPSRSMCEWNVYRYIALLSTCNTAFFMTYIFNLSVYKRFSFYILKSNTLPLLLKHSKYLLIFAIFQTFWYVFICVFSAFFFSFFFCAPEIEDWVAYCLCPICHFVIPSFCHSAIFSKL